MRSSRHVRWSSLSWLHYAARLGSPRALSWYNRICEAHGIATERDCSLIHSQNLESELAQIPTEQYLSVRIRSQVQVAILQTREITKNYMSGCNLKNLQDRVTISIFNEWERDEIGPIHLAALFGDNYLLESLL